jgi:hypothetical protein
VLLVFPTVFELDLGVPYFRGHVIKFASQALIFLLIFFVRGQISSSCGNLSFTEVNLWFCCYFIFKLLIFVSSLRAGSRPFRVAVQFVRPGLGLYAFAVLTSRSPAHFLFSVPCLFSAPVNSVSCIRLLSWEQERLASGVQSRLWPPVFVSAPLTAYSIWHPNCIAWILHRVPSACRASALACPWPPWFRAAVCSPTLIPCFLIFVCVVRELLHYLISVLFLSYQIKRSRFSSSNCI